VEAGFNRVPAGAGSKPDPGAHPALKPQKSRQHGRSSLCHTGCTNLRAEAGPRRARLAGGEPTVPICPCCGYEDAEFRPFGRRRRPNAQCPSCRSLERHRLIWLVLNHRTSIASAPTRLLHVAPEPALARPLCCLPTVTCVTGDLSRPADVRLDLTALPFRSGAFDAILCSHVLEHVPDDGAAMRELRRVLAPAGWAILHVPLNPSLERSFEDASITGPRERERAFGQHDHVRVYGRDYWQRLEEAGFDVEPCALAREIGEAGRQRYGLRNEVIGLCRPSRAAGGSRRDRRPRSPNPNEAT
jgi:SAM-dependent methyltransferase